MKMLSLFLALFLTLNVIGTMAKANQCAQLFNSKSTSSDVNQTSENAGLLLLEMFGAIANAPNKSSVKIYTNNIKNDGIGALLLLLSVSESSKARQLKFEILLGDQNSATRIHDLYAERSTNKVRFLNNKDVELSGKTVVAIQSGDSVKIIVFKGELTSEQLKDASQKAPIPVRYAGQNMLRASPFKNVEVEARENLEGIGVFAEYYKDLTSALSSNYGEAHTSRIRMNEADVVRVSKNAYDLALQLYILKHGKAPKEEMDALDIIRAATQN